MFQNTLPQNEEAHFSCRIPFLKTSKPNLLAKKCPSNRANPICWQNALPQNEQAQSAGGTPFLKTRKCNLLPEKPSPQRRCIFLSSSTNRLPPRLYREANVLHRKCPWGKRAKGESQQGICGTLRVSIPRAVAEGLRSSDRLRVSLSSSLLIIYKFIDAAF